MVVVLHNVSFLQSLDSELSKYNFFEIIFIFVRKKKFSLFFPILLQVEKAWEDLLFVHSGKVDLWQEYLSRQQCSRLQGFTVSSAVKRFHKCFQTLTSIMDGKVKVIQKTPNMEERMIGKAFYFVVEGKLPELYNLFFFTYFSVYVKYTNNLVRFTPVLC